MLQLDYLNKSLRPLIEALDPGREGKILYDQLKMIMREHTNGRGIDLWLTEP